MMEEWRKYRDMPYEVSNMGRVKSLSRTFPMKNPKSGTWQKRTLKERIRKPQEDMSGYHILVLSHNNKQSTHKIHRMVMEAFCGSSDLEVNHKNCVKTDNRLSNLEYVSRKENANHAKKMGRFKNNGSHYKDIPRNQKGVFCKL